MFSGMRVHRRQFLHLLGAVPLVGCSRDEQAPAPAVVPEEDPNKPWWLRGNFAPVSEIESTSLEIVGALPPELTGTYLRNGPNPLSGSSDHWFIGDGMVHGVRLGGGK